MTCSRVVFRCFKSLERLGDRITGAAGPYFIGLAVILIGIGTICFFDVILPGLQWPLISWPLCIIIALNLHLHYFYVCTVPPGFVEDPPRSVPESFLWAKKPQRKRALTSGVSWSSGGSVKITKAASTKCRKCGQVKPERTHHCRICNHCVLKYDHHCPVSIAPPSFEHIDLKHATHSGSTNVLAYITNAISCCSSFGYPYILEALGVNISRKWPHHVPELAYILTYILSVVLCLAVGIMLTYHLWTISKGETTVETQDHEHYSKLATSRGEDFVNSYDLGKIMNLKLFFNVWEGGYSFTTLLLPLRVPPYTDGRHWARRPGYEQHYGIKIGEEITDEEDEEEE